MPENRYGFCIDAPWLVLYAAAMQLGSKNSEDHMSILRFLMILVCIVVLAMAGAYFFNIKKASLGYQASVSVN